MSKLNNLENKVNRSRVPNFMIFILGLYVIGFILSLFFPGASSVLCFSPELILKGQVWRLISWICISGDTSILLLLLTCFIYWSISKTLEQVIGKFRLDCFLLTGILIFILYGFLWYFICQTNVLLLPYANRSQGLTSYFMITMVFTLLALMFPEVRFMLFFFIPISGKVMIYVTLILDAIECIQYFRIDVPFGLFVVGMVVFSCLNLILFLLLFRKEKSGSYKQKKPKVIRPSSGKREETFRDTPLHQCAVCGRTDKTNPELEFRYCSKCIGNYEYCIDHLYTHPHKKPGNES